ncbi:MAG TPA: sulfide/dihydroorotate dehydrogenase-like FAD/NAD-binding protein [Syntrophomonadaceae bacterium]|nr:sulfide/dihydroorotate dehydrogenase-like FAD/NAD-binding protein [Syntrophomonadaceae bacterium]
MYEIVHKSDLAHNIKLFKVYAPDIAKKAKPGQFVIVRNNEQGERIPLTIADYDRHKGTITIIFQEVGKSTIDMGKFEPGDKFLDFVGPLGKPSEIGKYGKIVCVGGGIGVAPIHPILRALYEKENYIISILGARNSDLLIWEEKIKAFSHETYLMTDDGSYGEKGLVTDALAKIISQQDIDMVLAIGPLAMMQAVSEVTRLKQIKTLVSLNPIMLDGTGMCGACRVKIGNENKFACVDGPEFDGHLVEWENAKQRAKMFKEQEGLALNYKNN